MLNWGQRGHESTGTPFPSTFKSTICVENWLASCILSEDYSISLCKPEAEFFQQFTFSLWEIIQRLI